MRIEEGASVAPAAHMVANEISPFFQEPENDRLYKYATELAREGDKEGFATAQGFYTLSFPVAREKWDNYSTALYDAATPTATIFTCSMSDYDTSKLTRNSLKYAKSIGSDVYWTLHGAFTFTLDGTNFTCDSEPTYPAAAE